MTPGAVLRPLIVSRNSPVGISPSSSKGRQGGYALDRLTKPRQLGLSDVAAVEHGQRPDERALRERLPAGVHSLRAPSMTASTAARCRWPASSQPCTDTYMPAGQRQRTCRANQPGHRTRGRFEELTPCQTREVWHRQRCARGDDRHHLMGAGPRARASCWSRPQRGTRTRAPAAPVRPLGHRPGLPRSRRPSGGHLRPPRIQHGITESLARWPASRAVRQRSHSAHFGASGGAGHRTPPRRGTASASSHDWPASQPNPAGASSTLPVRITTASATPDPHAPSTSR